MRFFGFFLARIVDKECPVIGQVDVLHLGVVVPLDDAAGECRPDRFRLAHDAASGNRWGPFVPRRPDHLMKRTIRGMLPYKRPRGVEAMKAIKCYVGIPVEFVGKEMEVLEEAHMNRLNNPNHITLGAVSTFLGAKF